MGFWLVKSEPSTWSWHDQVTKLTTDWDGVRNFQARNYLKQMQLGDWCFFYHSGEERQIMGIVEVSATYMPDPTDSTGKFGMVTMRYLKPLNQPVTLEQIKATPTLDALPLIRQSRLSVMPITKEQWQIIMSLAR